jgi:hypothetical protein
MEADRLRMRNLKLSLSQSIDWSSVVVSSTGVTGTLDFILRPLVADLRVPPDSDQSIAGIQGHRYDHD